MTPDTELASARPTLSWIALRELGQPIETVANALIDFISRANTSLDLAIYDAFFPDEPFDRDSSDKIRTLTIAILDALQAAEDRGVRVRAIYNDDDGPGPYPNVMQRGRPRSFLSKLGHAVPARGVDGRDDLMHHKYMVRDADDATNAAVWTGSTNWTADAFTTMENLVITVTGQGIARSYLANFEQLWSTGLVEDTGDFDTRPVAGEYRGEPFAVTAMFSPGRGAEMSQLIATRIGVARVRVRVCSPVVTSAPILGTLAEVIRLGRVDTQVTVDAPQMQQVERQWAKDPRSQWKLPILRELQGSGCFAAKQSTAFGTAEHHNFMHAKLVVTDDWVIAGSFNCSRSGERNAENVLVIRNRPFADECAAYAEAVHASYLASN